MEQVIVEWRAVQPLTPETLRSGLEQLSWCYRVHEVTPQRSYIGSDGRESVCLFAAHDAEAVRRVYRHSPSPADAVWTAKVLTAPDAPIAPPEGRAAVLVGRRFAEPADFDSLHALEVKGAWCLKQHEVRHLRSYLSGDARRMLCVYAAPDAEAVRQTQRQVGLPFERVWATSLCLWSEPQATS